jgi:hypothetical protein
MCKEDLNSYFIGKPTLGKVGFFFNALLIFKKRYQSIGTNSKKLRKFGHYSHSKKDLENLNLFGI